MSSDDYDEELLRMVISQPEPDSALSYFHVLALRDVRMLLLLQMMIRLRVMLLLILHRLIF